MPLTLSCSRSRAGTAITRKPFMVLTSMHDDVLEGDEMAQAAHAIGPNRPAMPCTARCLHERRSICHPSRSGQPSGLALAQGFPECSEEEKATVTKYVGHNV